MKNFFKEHWVIILILALGAFFRFWQIQTFPNGLFPDEAANGLDINSIFNGDIQPFYERGNGRESLFFYLLAASVALFGRGPWQHHVVTALIGLAEVFVTYLLVNRLFGKRIALLASFFMACSSYAVMLNRNAFRANTIPLFTTLTFYFLVKFFDLPAKERRSRLWAAFWAGISFGLGFYTYISYRMMVPLLAGMGALFLWAKRDKIRQLCRIYLKPKLVFLAGFVIAFAWLGIYFWQHPGSFIGRSGQVSIFNQDLNNGDVVGTFLTVVKQTILGFFTEGDANWRHNVSGYPFLSPFISPFFALALIVFSFAFLRLLYDVSRRHLSREVAYKALVAVWFWFMIVPEITTAEGIPHGLRLVGVIPPIFILAAWAVSKFWTLFKQVIVHRPGRWAFAGLFVLCILGYNYFLVFQIAAKSPEAYYAYRSDLTEVSNYLNERNDKSKTYLSLDKFSVQTVDYLTTPTNNPYQLVDPAHSFEVQLNPGDQIVFTQSTLFDTTKFIEHHPDAVLVRYEKNQFDQIILEVFQQP